MSKELREEYEKETNSMSFYTFTNKYNLLEVRHTKSYIEWLEQQNTELDRKLKVEAEFNDNAQAEIIELKAEVKRLNKIVGNTDTPKG